jgi:antitoxin (DNA-binding transcriptional repressor) of toxin-antitoxin stability system
MAGSYNEIAGRSLMTTTIDIRDLPQRLDEALGHIAAGGEVILADGATPRARLVPMVVAPPSGRVPGLHAGTMTIADDFDDPLPDSFWTGDS